LENNQSICYYSIKDVEKGFVIIVLKIYVYLKETY